MLRKQTKHFNFNSGNCGNCNNEGGGRPTENCVLQLNWQSIHLGSAWSSRACCSVSAPVGFVCSGSALQYYNMRVTEAQAIVSGVQTESRGTLTRCWEGVELNKWSGTWDRSAASSWRRDQCKACDETRVQASQQTQTSRNLLPSLLVSGCRTRKAMFGHY
jgi:hypothetical protein